MATQAAKGAALLEAGKYAEAIEQYTAALAISPTSPDYYIKRSTAHQRKHPTDFAAALRDAEFGVVAATARARRELMAQAQLRRGIALFGLEKYADAGFVFDIVKTLDSKEKMVGIWEAKVQQRLKTLEEGDERATVTVKKDPDVALPKPESSTPAATVVKSTTTKPAVTVTAIKPTPADKIKHDWYQNAEKVYLTLLAKGVPKDDTVIEIKPQSVSLTLHTLSHLIISVRSIYHSQPTMAKHMISVLILCLLRLIQAHRLQTLPIQKWKLCLKKLLRVPGANLKQTRHLQTYQLQPKPLPKMKLSKK
jgi:suppressor of G2 allele of SKP1